MSAVLVAIAYAPATVADALLDRATLGRVRLAEAEGTLWRGSARLVVGEGPSGAGAQTQGFALPGTLRWQVRRLPLALGLLDLTLAIDGAGVPVRISGQPNDLRIAAGEVRLPEIQLAALGSPWNTIRPTGVFALRWQSLALREGTLDGTLGFELRDVGSALTPVRPLGSYRVEVRGDGQTVTVVLSTIEGPLRLEGQGSWGRRQGLRFEAQARTTDDKRASLESLLALIGRREGDRTVIRIGG